MAREDDNDRADALVLACAAGDRSAFRRLYDLQAPRLHAIALRILRQAPLAADAVQETFLQAWQQSARFEPARGSAEAWLTGLVRYRALDLLRRPGPLAVADPPDLPDPSPDALSLLTSASEAEALRACLAQLEPERRELILRAFFDGLTHAELAARAALPLGTVKTWIRKGLAALRACLGP